MKILFTGTSSFTGLWFISELAKRGHEVHAVCRRGIEGYEGLRKKRVEKLLPLCQVHFSLNVGSDDWFKFVDREGPFDLFCHHAADTENYRSFSFDCAEAVANNARGAGRVLQSLKENGCSRLLLTGSYFETEAFTPYGLSKALSSEIFLFYAKNLQIKLGKFVIANPFGPYEEDRYTSYLIDCWKEKKIAYVKTPDYLRDNVPVLPLSIAYADFAERLSLKPGVDIFRPSGYVETQGSFTKRFAREMGSRLGLDCPFVFAENPSYLEPMELKNSDCIIQDWDEKGFWDDLAQFYRLFLIL